MAIVKSKYAWRRAAQVDAAKAQWVTTDFATQVKEWMISKLNEWVNNNWGFNKAPNPTTPYVAPETNKTSWDVPSGKKEATIEQTDEQKALEEQKKQLDEASKSNAEAITNATKANADNAELLKQQKELAESNAKQIQAEKEAEAQRFESELKARQAEAEAQIQKDAANEQAILKAQQETDLEQTKAEWEALKASQARAIEEAKVKARVNEHNALMAFEKLWMTFSWAAITWVQAITNQSILSIAELETKNAKDYADWSKKASDIAIKYTQAINKSISDVTKKVHDSRVTLDKDISSIRDNIILSKSEKNKKIEDALSNYIKQKQDAETELYDRIEKQSASLKKSHDLINENITKQQDSYKKTLEILINNGQINSKSRAEINDLERKAWLPVGWVANMTLSTIYKWVIWLMDKRWYWADIPPEVLSKIVLSVQRQGNINVPLDIAINNAFNQYTSELPWVFEATENRRLKMEKERAEIDKIRSEVEENRAQAKAAWRSWGWGWSSSPASKKPSTMTVEWWKIMQWENWKWVDSWFKKDKAASLDELFNAVLWIWNDNKSNTTTSDDDITSG